MLSNKNAGVQKEIAQTATATGNDSTCTLPPVVKKGLKRTERKQREKLKKQKR